MGCAQSRVDNEEAVARCKERRNVIKEAVAASKAFAAGHFAYAIALKNTGAALSDYGHGESDQKALDDALDQNHYEKQSRNNVDPAAPQPPPPPPIENLPPPPPPLPKFSPSPIKRAISLPTMAVRGRKAQALDAMAIEEEEEDEEEEEEVKDSARATARKVEEEEASPRTPENVGNNARKRGEIAPEIMSASPGNSMAWDYFFMVENMPGPNLDDREMRNGYENQNNHFQFSEEKEEEEEEERSGIFRKNSVSHKIIDEIEPKTPEKVEEVEEEEDEEEEEEEEEEEDEVVVEAKKKKGKAKIEHSNTAPPEFRRAVTKTTTASSSLNLMKILDEIDDRFLNASECAQEVSKMLEATRLHYHSNFADNQGNCTPL